MRPRAFLLLYAVAALVVTALAWHFTYQWQLADLRNQADERLSLKSHSVITEIERYRYLPSVVAKDERIHRLLEAEADPALVNGANSYLEAVNQSARSDNLYVLDGTGTTLAASNWNTPQSFVGQSYAFRPYFTQAIKQGSAQYYAIGVTTGKPGYFQAYSIGTDAGASGVAVVKIDISALENTWTEAGELVGLVDHAGMIFLSSVADWRFRPLFPISDDDRRRILEEHQYGPQTVDRAALLSGPRPNPGQDVYLSVQGKTMLVRILDIPSEGWWILAAYDVAPVNLAAGLVAVVVFLSAALLFAVGFYLRERGQRIQANELRAILENVSVGIAVFDTDLRLRAWNSRYLGLNSYPETLIRRGRPFAEIIQFNIDRGAYGPGDPKTQLQERIDRARQQTAQQFEVRRPDGTWIEIKRNRMPGGRLIHTHNDITERKQTEAELAGHRNNLERLVEERTAELVHLNERLQTAVEQTEAEKQRAEQADRAKTTFLNAVSHDIRNPLNAILGYASLVMANAKDSLPARQYANLEKLAAKGRELNELVNDFLDYTRADQVNTTAFHLRPVIEECLATIELTIDTDRVQIACDIPEDMPELVQDRKKLGRIISNLMSNAAKFTEKGTIQVSASHNAGLMRIAVADTGIGIAEEHLGLIFEEFERVEPRGQRKREGTGLGLAICRRFAALMGGEISVRSLVGEGSVFTFSFPTIHPRAVASKDDAPIPAPRYRDGIVIPDQAVGDGGAKATVLIVDDSKANRDFLFQLLESKYRVLVATDGKSAIETTRLEKPDLILMDLSLPILDGWEATRTIKHDPLLRQIPIIAVTAHVTQNDREEVSAAGCDGFLAKPVDEKALLEILRRYLGSQSGGNQ